MLLAGVSAAGETCRRTAFVARGDMRSGPGEGRTRYQNFLARSLRLKLPAPSRRWSSLHRPCRFNESSRPDLFHRLIRGCSARQAVLTSNRFGKFAGTSDTIRVAASTPMRRLAVLNKLLGKAGGELGFQAPFLRCREAPAGRKVASGSNLSSSN